MNDPISFGMGRLRVLFVDDEPLVLQGLRRMLYPLRQCWDMAFAGSGPEALALLAQAPFDVVVADMRMPGMDGVELFREVKKRHPQIARVILSGQAGEELVFQAVSLAHQYLSKPCDAATLKAAVDRLLRLRPFLQNEAVLQVVGGLASLPSLPTLYAELVAETLSPFASVKRLGEIIARDMAMTAKILQLVNSAFFGLRRRVTGPAQAVELLGLETIKTLVLTCQVFEQFEAVKVKGFSLVEMWDHSLTTARLAQVIAAAAQAPQETQDQAFLAGMLHDAGKLLLAAHFPEKYQEVVTRWRHQEMTVWGAEREVFGVSHAEVGAYLFGLWGLPDDMVEAVGYHHEPGKAGTRGFTALTAVHVANVCPRQRRDTGAATPLENVDKHYLEQLHMWHHIFQWQELCLETNKLWMNQ